MPERLELSDKIASTRRQPIDAEWSKPKKIAFASVAGTIAVAGLAWGIVSFIQSRPPSMPTTPQEAVLALASNNFDRLDGERQEAIRSQAVRLLAEAPEETRRELRESIELSEEGRQQLREAFMEDMVRKFARGEGNPWEAMMRGGPGGPRPQGERTGEGRPGGGERSGEGGRPGGGPGGPGGGGGEEGPSRAERQAEFRSRIQERMASGNSQTMALMGEFFSSMRKQREAAGNSGGGGRRGGGGG